MSWTENRLWMDTEERLSATPRLPLLRSSQSCIKGIFHSTEGDTSYWTVQQVTLTYKQPPEGHEGKGGRTQPQLGWAPQHSPGSAESVSARHASLFGHQVTHSKFQKGAENYSLYVQFSKGLTRHTIVLPFSSHFMGKICAAVMTALASANGIFSTGKSTSTLVLPSSVRVFQILVHK